MKRNHRDAAVEGVTASLCRRFLCLRVPAPPGRDLACLPDAPTLAHPEKPPESLNRVWRILDLRASRGPRPTDDQVAQDRYEGAVPVSQWLARGPPHA